MKTALMNIFNVSYTIATRLTWGGLQHTAAWQNLSNAEKTRYMKH